MVSLSLIGFILGAMFFGWGVLHDPKRPFSILLGLGLLVLSSYLAGII